MISDVKGIIVGLFLGLVVIGTCAFYLYKDYKKENEIILLVYVDIPEVAADGVVSAQRVYKVKKRNYNPDISTVILIDPEDEFGNKYKRLVFKNRKVTIEEK